MKGDKMANRIDITINGEKIEDLEEFTVTRLSKFLPDYSETGWNGLNMSPVLSCVK